MPSVTLRGEITTLIDALGENPESETVTEAQGLFGELSEQRLDPRGAGLRKDWLTRDYRATGATFSFGDDELCKVVVRLRPETGWSPYPRADRLIDGVDASSSRETLRTLLGAPKKTRPDTDLWQLGRRFLHVRYTADGAIGRVSVMLRSNGQ